ncbi:MAG: hypothetical protein HKN87_00170 [Saprospiraceae bacterium]|nr:hypothetical protein [Saprospiraceae bacterium]
MTRGCRKKNPIVFNALILALTILSVSICPAQQSPGTIYKEGPVKAKMIDGNFLYGDSNYNGIAYASDGNVYYVICSHNKKSGAQLFRYNPRTGNLDNVGDLTTIVGEDRTKVINQGKVHCDLYEYQGKLWFGTHAGAYDRTYPGGHFMSYDLKTEKFEDFGIAAPNEGLVAVSMDTSRERMYAVTWPGYSFLYFDMNTKKVERWMEAIAPTPQQGPRSLGVDAITGNVYWHTMFSTIQAYNYGTNEISTLEKPNFKQPMFNIPLAKKGVNYSVGVAWRSVKWNRAFEKFYAIMYFSDWLVSFDPKVGELEILDRIPAAPNKKSGGTDYTSLAFELSEDGETIFYIAPYTKTNADGTSGESEIHLVTYHIPGRQYTDHGPVELNDGRRPRYCQGLEVGRNGMLYIVGWVNITDKTSDKWKNKLAIETADKPTMEVEQSTQLQEINLMEIRNPLMEPYK